MIVIGQQGDVKMTASGYLFQGPSDDPTEIIGHINDLSKDHLSLYRQWRSYCECVLAAKNNLPKGAFA